MLEAIDHLVLTVKDLAQTIAFYRDILGMQVEYFGKNQERVALKFGSQKINLHEWKKEFEPKAKYPTPGSIDICFLTKVPLEKVMDHLQKSKIEIIEGPVERTGAQGKILSVYIRDPDENLLEIANLAH